MFVSAWVDQFLHFGNHTTNRVESQHSKLKKYLETSQADLNKILSHIHQVIQSQDTSIKSSFETSKNIRKHRFQKTHFEELWGLVSLYALDMIYREHMRSRETSVFSENCGCIMRTSHGLPCAHEQALYACQGIPIPLDAIDVFWKKLDFSPCASAHDYDIQCDDEIQMFRENFYKQPIPKRKNLLKRLKNIIMPSNPLFDEPSAHRTTRGRPSQKNQDLNKKIPEDPRRRSCSTVPTFIKSEGFVHQESARHSSYFSRQPPSNPYLDQIPSLFHPYITQIQDVLGDGNCGFRAISTCLGGHEDQWDDIRRELIVELTEYQPYYSFVFGSDECQRINEALNFFQKGVFAPPMHWIVMPEMGILVASRFNVILHVLNMAGSVTYLPFRTPPPSSSSQHVSIAIVHVNGNHYIKVVLNGEYPMPTLTHHWERCRFPVASTWINPYIRRLDMYQEYIERTRTREYIDLNE